MNKGYDSLVELFKKNSMDPNRYQFIDCVTMTVIRPKKQENCVFVSSPASLTELNIALRKLLDNGCDTIILDSISTMRVYNKDDDISHFIHHMINEIKVFPGVKLMLTISEGDKSTKVYKNLCMMVDTVS